MYIPRQLLVLHGCSSFIELLPLQELSLNVESVHGRDLDRLPTPQLTEHFDHLDQLPHIPITVIWLYMYLIVYE